MIPELGLVFDGGSGFYKVLERVQTPELDVFFSHAHIDHTCGVPAVQALLFFTQCKTVRFHGLQETLDAIKTLLTPPLFPEEVNVNYCPLDNGPLKIQGVTITHFSLVHRGPCVGYRVEGPNVSFAYVTDTTSTLESPYLPELIGVRVLAHEMYNAIAEHEKAPKIGHTSVLGLKIVAEKIGAKKVVAIHHNPNGNVTAIEEEAKAQIPGLIFATDGLEIGLAP
jgi:ribonuclease BN (tRNA processing enzyme)